MLCSGQVPREVVEKEDYEKNFEEVPRPFSAEEREEWLKTIGDVVVSSDAFFPFIDNVLRAGKYISEKFLLFLVTTSTSCFTRRTEDESYL